MSWARLWPPLRLAIVRVAVVASIAILAVYALGFIILLWIYVWIVHGYGNFWD